MFEHRGSAYIDEAWDMEGMAEWAQPHIPSTVDTLVGTGMSGCLIVPRLADAMGLAWAVVRKDGVKSHSESPSRYEGQMGRGWALVDDFMCSGDSVVSIAQAVYDEFVGAPSYRHREVEFLGGLFYRHWRSGMGYTDPFLTPAQIMDEISGYNRPTLSRLTGAPVADEPQAEHPEAASSTPEPAPASSPSPVP